MTSRRHIHFPLLLLLLVAVLAPAEHRPLSDFADGPGGWQRRTYTPANEPRLFDLATQSATEDSPAALRLPIELPGKNEFVLPLDASWQGYQTLQLDFILPEGLPAKAPETIAGQLPEQTYLYVFAKDWDHLWRQVRIPVPAEPGPWTVRVPVAGDDAVEQWQSQGHDRPWNPVITRALLEMGCAFNLEPGLNAEFAGEILLVGAQLADPGLPQETPIFRHFSMTPDSPHVGGRYEIAFEYGEWFADPFDPAKTDITAAITQPDGNTVTIRAFYFEDFLYNPEIEAKEHTLRPSGRPQFKFRYCPLLPGPHTVEITARANGRTATAPTLHFEARPPDPDYRGFIRRDPQEEVFLAWENGETFWGLGMNVRSPYDNRYVGIAPHSPWRDEGLPLYERLFAEYEKAGITVVEVWMSSWWLALEWINDAPGFHGVGHYNQYRAWMLDRILEAAERHNILLILAFNNHGKFGMMYDTEWDRNPYNKECGGFLDNCEQYFADPRAREAFKRTCDYIVARWGYSPNIMSWKLFTEVDLTGTTMEFYKQPEVAEWHREMGAYLKEIDPNQHLVTTHWMLSYHRINAAIANLPEIDFLTGDAYYQGGGTQQLLNLFLGGAKFARNHRKPFLITEFGGSPYADTMGNLIKQLHLGIWVGFFTEAPASPMYWWFALADDKQLYDQFLSLHRYSQGEDRRGLAINQRDLPGTTLAVYDMTGTDRYYAWIFDSGYYTSPTENLSPRNWRNLQLPLEALAPGDYTLEIWDVAKGIIAEQRPMTIAEGGEDLTIPLPPFVLDLALKIKPVEAESKSE